MGVTDHDMLIRIDQNVRNMTQKFEDLPCEAHSKKMDTMITKSWFKWVITGLIVGGVGLAGLGTANKLSLAEISVKQEVMLNKINMNNGD